MALPFELEGELERRIAADSEWQEGIEWDEAQRGHPEGAVKNDIADVLASVEREAASPDDRRRLRPAALVRNTFKYRAPEASARVGSEGHHGSHAPGSSSASSTTTNCRGVVRRHDEAFAAWLVLVKRGDRGRAEQRARRLVERLGDASPLDLRFFGADNATTEKSPNRPSGSSRWCSKRGRQVWRCS